MQRKMLQNKSKNRGENVILELVEALKNKGLELPRTHKCKSEMKCSLASYI